jgi:hypothetical protein
MINHILVNKLYDEDYVLTHTNALFLGDEAFDFKDGVFSGFDAENHKYQRRLGDISSMPGESPVSPRVWMTRTASSRA